MATQNDITGDAIKSQTTNDKYRDGWEAIFGKKKETQPQSTDKGDK